MEDMVISGVHRGPDLICLGALCEGGVCMNQMTVNQGCILHHLKRHSELKSIEVAEDMKCDLKEAENDLNALRDQGLAVEEYATEVGYVWRAIA